MAEVLIALAIGTMALAGAFLLDSHQMLLVKSTRESGAASMSLEERVEQLRIATWRQITDPEYLTKTYFKTVPRSIAPLDEYTEKVSVTAWPDEAAAAPLVVEKRKNAAATVITDGAGLSNQRLAKVTVHIAWSGSNDRERTRELASIISNGGISRMNLPSMGNASGAPPTDTVDMPDATTPPEGESPEATPQPSPEVPAPSNGNGGNKGNGKGRGNVSGKPGKK